MHLRSANVSDLDPLLPLMDAFNQAEQIAIDHEKTKLALQRLLGDASLGRVVVVDIDGRLEGYGVVTWGFDLEFGGRDAFLTEIFVQTDRRRRGVGRALLEELLRVAHDAGASALHLGVYPTNTAALSLYRSAGFARIPRDFYTRQL